METSPTNHLAEIHAGNKADTFTDEKNTNHYATKNEANDQQLGEVPEVLPTTLGGIELEAEPTEMGIEVPVEAETTNATQPVNENSSAGEPTLDVSNE